MLSRPCPAGEEHWREKLGGFLPPAGERWSHAPQPDQTLAYAPAIGRRGPLQRHLRDGRRQRGRLSSASPNRAAIAGRGELAGRRTAPPPPIWPDRLQDRQQHDVPLSRHWQPARNGWRRKGILLPAHGRQNKRGTLSSRKTINGIRKTARPTCRCRPRRQNVPRSVFTQRAVVPERQGRRLPVMAWQQNESLGQLSFFFTYGSRNRPKKRNALVPEAEIVEKNYPTTGKSLKKRFPRTQAGTSSSRRGSSSTP